MWCNCIQWVLCQSVLSTFHFYIVIGQYLPERIKILFIDLCSNFYIFCVFIVSLCDSYIHLLSHLIPLSKFNLPLMAAFYVIHPTRAIQSRDLSIEGINSGSHTYFFWPHKDMEGLPGWVISPVPGPPPRQHKHERQYTPSTHSIIPTRRIWNNDDDGQMIFGDLVGLKLPNMSYRWGKTPKKPHPGNLSRPGIEPGPSAWQARMLPLAPQRWTICFYFVKNLFTLYL